MRCDLTHDFELSVVIVSYNTPLDTSHAISSVSAIECVKEIVIVINGDSKKEQGEYKKINEKVREIQLDQNYGFAIGVNVGVLNAKCDYVLVLNSDASFLDGNLAQVVSEMRNGDVSLCQLDVRKSHPLAEQEIAFSDGKGAYLDIFGNLYHHNFFPSLRKSNEMIEAQPFAIKGAVFIVHKPDFIAVGMFDSSFWCYWEESDICHRLVILGKRFTFSSAAIFLHLGGKSSQKKSLEFKKITYNLANKLSSHCKNFGPLTLLWLIPSHLVWSTCFGVLSLFLFRPIFFVAALVSPLIVLTRVPIILNDRRNVQKRRVMSDALFFQQHIIRPSFKFYFTLLKGFVSGQ